MERSNYTERLAQGRTIGSGLIEGACKNLVGQRMKQTGAAWRLERANKMTLVCSLLYDDQWKIAWKIDHLNLVYGGLWRHMPKSGDFYVSEVVG